MAKMSFKFTMEDIHTKANRLVRTYLQEEDEVMKNFIISDLVNLTDELVRSNIYKFKIQMNVPEMDDEEAYGLCMGTALLKALSLYDTEKGVHFTTFWHTIMTRTLLNELKRITTKKEKMNRKDTISGDLTYSKEWGTDLFSAIPSGEDISDSVCSRVVLQTLIKKFEEIDPYGRLIECEMLGNKSDKTQAILQILGADEYGDRERQIVRRTKVKFKNFLIENKFDVQLFI